MGAAANRYAKALVDVLYPDHAAAGLQQLQTLDALLKEHPDARRIFENPTFSSDGRKKLLHEISQGLSFEKRLSNFVSLLVERNRLDILDEIIAAYQKFLDERMGIVRALVTSAKPLESAQKNELTAKLEKMTGKQVRMEVAIDPSLIGGLVAQVEGTIYDGSIRQQLQAFRERLVEK